MTHVLQQQFLYCFTWSISQLLLLKNFSFSSDFSTSQLHFFFFFWSLNFLSCTSKLTCFRISVLFWMLWMLVTVNKPCHVPHASQITTSGTIFTEIFLGVSKEWISSLLHASKVSNLKTFGKKLLPARQKQR